MEDENGNGRFEFYLGETDPLNPDTDGDGVNDQRDDYPLGTAPPQVEEDDDIKGTTILIFLISAIILIVLTVITTFLIMRSTGRIEE